MGLKYGNDYIVDSIEITEVDLIDHLAVITFIGHRSSDETHHGIFTAYETDDHKFEFGDIEMTQNHPENDVSFFNHIRKYKFSIFEKTLADWR